MKKLFFLLSLVAVGLQGMDKREAEELIRRGPRPIGVPSSNVNYFRFRQVQQMLRDSRAAYERRKRALEEAEAGVRSMEEGNPVQARRILEKLNKSGVEIELGCPLTEGRYGCMQGIKKHCFTHLNYLHLANAMAHPDTTIKEDRG